MSALNPLWCVVYSIILQENNQFGVNSKCDTKSSVLVLRFRELIFFFLMRE